MEAIAVLLTAFILDLLWGDPRWLPHPVVGIGWCISRLERGLMRLIRRFSLNPATDAGKIRLLGLLFPLVIAGGTFGVTWLAVKVCREWNELAGAVLEAILIWLTIAPRGLAEAGDKIYRALVAGDLKQARHELSMVVGRETAHLDSAEIVRGGVETVAENIVDAIISPLFYAAIGGAPLAFAYRAVNTLDAMVGYRNEKYLYLGWASAKLDDIANWLPARLAILPMLLSLFLIRLDPVGAWKVCRRDARLHPSPNSGIPEALMAGGLRIQLGGTNVYQGKVSHRAKLGDPLDERRPEHLRLAVRVMWWSSVFFLAGLCGLIGTGLLRDVHF